MFIVMVQEGAENSEIASYVTREQPEYIGVPGSPGQNSHLFVKFVPKNGGRPGMVHHVPLGRVLAIIED